MENSIIKISQLYKSYGREDVIKNMNLEISKGKIIGLLGPNGAGKTTLFKILGGLITDYRGNVLIDGQKIGKYSKQIISYLPDHDYFAPWMKVKDVYELFKDMYSDFDDKKCAAMFQKFNFDMNMSIKTMSKGTKERFALCMVMSRRAKIYLLDEPLAAVDPASREVIMQTIVENFSEDAVMIISTHIISELENMLDEVVFINQGEFILHEDCETLRQEKNMSVNDYFKEVFVCLN